MNQLFMLINYYFFANEFFILRTDCVNEHFTLMNYLFGRAFESRSKISAEPKISWEQMSMEIAVMQKCVLKKITFHKNLS